MSLVSSRALERSGQGQAVHAGELQVHQDQPGAEVLQYVQGFLRVLPIFFEPHELLDYEG